MNATIHSLQSAWTSGSRIAWVSVGLVLAGFLLGATTASAQAEGSHRVVWSHDAPDEVSTFVALVWPAGGDMDDAARIDLGKTLHPLSGTGSHFSAIIPVASTDNVVVYAVGRNGLSSEYSNAKTPTPTRPGQPVLVGP